MATSPMPVAFELTLYIVTEFQQIIKAFLGGGCHRGGPVKPSFRGWKLIWDPCGTMWLVSRLCVCVGGRSWELRVEALFVDQQLDPVQWKSQGPRTSCLEGIREHRVCYLGGFCPGQPPPHSRASTPPPALSLQVAGSTCQVLMLF